MLGQESKWRFAWLFIIGFLFSSFPALAERAEINNLHQHMSLLFTGFLLAVFIGGVLLYFTTKGIRFLYYAGYLMMSLCWLNSRPDGFSFNDWAFSSSLSSVFFCAMLLFSLHFMPKLQKSGYTKRIKKVKRTLTVVCATWLLVSFFLPYQLASLGSLTLSLTLVIGFVCVGFIAYKQAISGAKSYISAWVFTFLFLVFYALNQFGLFGADYVFKAILIAMFGQTLLLAIALAFAYSEERFNALATQKEALIQAQHASEAQAKLIEVQIEQQEELEAMVQERTFELEVTLRELQEKNQELEEKSTLDPLTGIRNRRFFDKKLLAEYRRSRREQTCLTVIMLDIDHFKRVNDTYGHQAGDDVIRQVAKIAESLLKRPTDAICRYGGEEFALILPATEAEGGLQMAEDIRQQITEKDLHTCGGALSITISAGVASCIASGKKSEADLLKSADDALYQAKQTGRNKVVVSN
ncbi:sensor domain-containing diguanylate cyclase [Algibacillus agarilyticus]|uniref:sensor domain-containing diguanylate cyclase n=1 Tax=Algibacillus agarilyticus TaxID=2234133 RepID=UPI000DCFC79D|nr:diguanylate cyclase [Algibacillus agarilyticus]